MVGGGQIALRKVRTLLECKAKVQVINPDLCSALGQLAESGEIHVLNAEMVSQLFKLNTEKQE